MPKAYNKMKTQTLRDIFMGADGKKKVQIIAKLMPDINDENSMATVFELLGARNIQLVILEALEFAIKNEDSKMLTKIIDKVLPSVKEIGVSGSIDHNYSKVQRQVSDMSEEEVENLVKGHVRNKRDNRMLVEPDYEILEQ